MRARRPQIALAPCGGQKRPDAWWSCMGAAAAKGASLGATGALPAEGACAAVTTSATAGAVGLTGAGLPAGSGTVGGGCVSAVAKSSWTAARLLRREEGRLLSPLVGLLQEDPPFMLPLSTCSGLAGSPGFTPSTVARTLSRV